MRFLDGCHPSGRAFPRASGGVYVSPAMRFLIPGIESNSLGLYFVWEIRERMEAFAGNKIQYREERQEYWRGEWYRRTCWIFRFTLIFLKDGLHNRWCICIFDGKLRENRNFREDIVSDRSFSLTFRNRIKRKIHLIRLRSFFSSSFFFLLLGVYCNSLRQINFQEIGLGVLVKDRARCAWLEFESQMDGQSLIHLAGPSWP